jgi:hypothetical protein|tara:strand:- start:445 stop:1164 length:720 start_codon:yes stop_codon:yes gene_type:complete
MKKNFIVENIEKYFLGGLVGGVVWNLDGSKVNINFSTETKDAVGELSFDLSLPEGKIGIYNTDSLLRLLGITNEDLQLELKSDNTGIVNKLKISDNKFDLDYNLSDATIIQEVPKVQEVDYDFTFKINDEFITGFLKAHNALEKIKDFTLNTATTKQDENVVEIMLGERTKHSNKVKFTEPAEFELPSDIIPFSAIVFREILSANKGVEGTMSVSNKGLAKIEFTNKESSVKYFVVRQQ